MVASSQHLASVAGYNVLRRGGNATDAAVAMLATLAVIEPQSVGIGGDAFAILYQAKERRFLGLNGSGRAPRRAEMGWFHSRGLKEIPERGILSVTVPGALHAWDAALERCGTLSLGELLQEAIHHAEAGFPVAEITAAEWARMTGRLRNREGWARTFLPDGRSPRPGQLFANPDLARTLKAIAREGVGVLYGGPVGEAVVRCSDRLGGLLSLEDLRDHASSWVAPISTTYRGRLVWELPPNGQGLVALEMLNILEGYDMAGVAHNGPDHLHLLVEAKKAAFRDRERYVADPQFRDVPVARLTSKAYAEEVRGRIDLQRAQQASELARPDSPSDTVYVAAVDGEGNAASFISSIFHHFGSGVIADGTGILLQNRGRSFCLEPGHANCLEPGKRPMHTIIPAMLFEGDAFLMAFGVVGADMQPQGHVQFLMNLVDFHMNLQEAMDAPRVRHLHGRTVYLEDGIPRETAAALRRRGHEVASRQPRTNEAGGGQAIYRDPRDGVLLGASDRRKDGCAIGF
jgi:gamma-glutamyltranspeptidase/glutathione hydrolase